jgi:tetratricopeptide (TPR) repeat protein
MRDAPGPGWREQGDLGVARAMLSPQAKALRFGGFWPPALIALAGALAYANSFSVPLVFDDLPSIADNRTIRHWSTALSSPLASTTTGRPFLNLSLAANYAISGTDVWSYHALNLAIHILAGLALYGILRRTLAAQADGRAASAGLVAFSVSLLWILHPLQTEAVTYVIQRAESLMGLLYLLTLYGFIRYAEESGDGRAAGARNARCASLTWFGLSWLACLLGMATKEVMASAPLIVFLYDRTFVAGSFREAWRVRWRAHAGLAATWLIMPFLVISAHGRNGTAGFGGGVTALSYGLTELPAIAHYLRLCFWPHPLVFYYGRALITDPLRIVPCGLVVAFLAAWTVYALVRRPALGFLGACFFLILAPTSSVVPVADTISEHRMYLSLIPVLVLVVLGLYRWLGRSALLASLVLATVLLAMTWQRNETYGSALGLWSDTAANFPSSPWVHNDFGSVLEMTPGRLDDAIAQYEEALRLKPDYDEAHNNLGNALLKVPGRLDEAIGQYEEALRLKPDHAEVHDNLGNALLRIPGRLNDAIAQYEEALRLDPDNAAAHINLGNALSQIPGRMNDAIAQCREAVRLEPDDAAAHFHLANAWSNAPGKLDEAFAEYYQAIRLRPDYAEAHYNLGVQLLRVPGRGDEARAQLAEFLRLWPDKDQARQILARIQASPP